MEKSSRFFDIILKRTNSGPADTEMTEKDPFIEAIDFFVKLCPSTADIYRSFKGGGQRNGGKRSASPFDCAGDDSFNDVFLTDDIKDDDRQNGKH